jgi:hypothetical protein
VYARNAAAVESPRFFPAPTSSPLPLNVFLVALVPRPPTPRPPSHDPRLVAKQAVADKCPRTAGLIPGQLLLRASGLLGFDPSYATRACANRTRHVYVLERASCAAARDSHVGAGRQGGRGRRTERQLTGATTKRRPTPTPTPTTTLDVSPTRALDVCVLAGLEAGMDDGCMDRVADTATPRPEVARKAWPEAGTRSGQWESRTSSRCGPDARGPQAPRHLRGANFNFKGPCLLVISTGLPAWTRYLLPKYCPRNPPPHYARQPPAYRCTQGPSWPLPRRPAMLLH